MVKYCIKCTVHHVQCSVNDVFQSTACWVGKDKMPATLDYEYGWPPPASQPSLCSFQPVGRCFTVKNAFAGRAFSLLYQGLLPIMPGKVCSLASGEFYPLYQVTLSTFTVIEGNPYCFFYQCFSKMYDILVEDSGTDRYTLTPALHIEVWYKLFSPLPIVPLTAVEWHIDAGNKQISNINQSETIREGIQP